MKKKITAVIPIRKGSQRVIDKNLRPFAGTTLLDNKIRELLKVPQIDEIIVNTNSEAAIELVEIEYAGTKVRAQLREEYYASSRCSGSEFFKHLGEVTDTDIFMYSPCTSPFVSTETFSKCIDRFLLNSEGSVFDSVSTVSYVKEFLWLNGKPINYDPANAPNSQDLPNVVALNFGVSVISKGDLIDNHNIIGKKPDFIVTSDIEAIDIDTPLDFYMAEQIYIKTILNGKSILDR